MKRYIKMIVLSVALLALIALITLAMIFDVDVVLFKNLSIASIQQKKFDVEALLVAYAKEETNNSNAKDNLKAAKNSFDVAKQTYDNIDASTIEIVQEATKEEKYFIEYLWIVLGNYATANDLAISIITPGSTVDIDKNTTTNNQTNNVTNNQENNQTNTNSPIIDSVVGSNTTSNNAVRVIVEGRYANVADFVFDVENDKNLKFKLDNIKMAYKGNNKIQASFEVLSLSVLK